MCSVYVFWDDTVADRYMHSYVCPGTLTYVYSLWLYRWLAAALGSCTRLSRLDLGSNRVGAAGVSLVAGSLAGCKSLTSLDLRLNRIGAKGAEHLARELG